MATYIILKDVDGEIQEKPQRELMLSEVRDAVVAGPYEWGPHPQGETVIHNDDGTTAVFSADEGFWFGTEFVRCSPFYHGIACYTLGNPTIEEFVGTIATKLGVKSFLIDSRSSWGQTGCG